MHLWNTLDNDVRNAAFSSYKSALKHIYFENFTYKGIQVFFNKYSLRRYASILHTSLRFGFSGLNSYLFRIKCKLSPSCTCGYREESVLHCFISCPRYAAQRTVLFTCAVQLLGSVWSNSTEYERVKLCLHGSGEVRLQINRRFFATVQKYIIDTNCFSIPNVWPNVFYSYSCFCVCPQVRGSALDHRQDTYKSETAIHTSQRYSIFKIQIN